MPCSQRTQTTSSGLLPHGGAITPANHLHHRPRIRTRWLTLPASQRKDGRHTARAVPLPCTSSGARYSGVPHSVYVRSFTTLAKPKSTTCAAHTHATKMCYSQVRHSVAMSALPERSFACVHLQVAVPIKHKVLRLQVPIRDHALMQVVQHRRHCAKERDKASTGASASSFKAPTNNEAEPASSTYRWRRRTWRSES